ncbi:HupE/UreJ family protein [Novosphingopyxis sp. YJ-S2-01]|uniref:HupE/UreJ family protein n=1 Tax=Novosphingopyxis sp. YJ-S2-01 TaxID=2794021 RepID=UPI0018DEC719|nr:HupE/UreJ family protein [Novosphingopyxis sp. YJ-S2-01]MBH9536149.1 HupE/UreJ family protein [Novosphingopyxis sp. YJ-S2-01]
MAERHVARMIALLLTLFALMLSGAAAAHVTPNSEVQIDFGPSEARADIIVPLGDYAAASGNPVAWTPQNYAKAQDWLKQHIGIRSPDGRAWTIEFLDTEFAQIAGPPDLHAVARLVPPAGAPVRQFTVDWRAVVDVNPAHFVLFVAKRDLYGRYGDEREIIGAVRSDRMRLAVDRGHPSAMTGFANAVRLGGEHIAEGHDHLLFLLALFLPMPLVLSANRKRWGGPRPPKDALWGMTKIITSFTIGHSLTLIAAPLLGLHLPAQPVEVAIAISILVSAIHAWRPIFPGREPLVAVVFGLIHGLAFATLVGDLGLGVNREIISILGFNIGIEIVQLGVVLAFLPALMIFARTRHYDWLRLGGAAFAGFAAICWMIERIFATENPLAAFIDALLNHSPLLVALLTVAAVVTWLADRRKDRAAAVAA